LDSLEFDKKLKWAQKGWKKELTAERNGERERERMQGSSPEEGKGEALALVVAGEITAGKRSPMRGSDRQRLRAEGGQREENEPGRGLGQRRIF
jgi:hypothetical protein